MLQYSTLKLITGLLLSATLLAGCGGGSSTEAAKTTDGEKISNEGGNNTETQSGISANIEKVYLHRSSHIGVGGLLTFDRNPYVLFKDGTFLKDIIEPLETLDIKHSKIYDSDRWGTWRRNGENTTFEIKGEESETFKENKLLMATGAPKNFKLNGEWEHVSGTGIDFGNSVMLLDTITFLENGQFTFDSFKTGTISNGAADVTTITTDPARRGTYKLSGYTLELNYDSGDKEAFGFYFWIDEKTGRLSTGALGIEGKTYWKQDEEAEAK